MTPEPKFAIGDVIYVKNLLAKSVTRGTICGITLKVWGKDFRGKTLEHMVVYTLNINDRKDGGFTQRCAPENECFPSWEEAWWEDRS